MGTGALRNSVREGRDAGVGRFHSFIALFGCTSRVLWLSYWVPHFLLPEVETLADCSNHASNHFTNHLATLLLPDTSRQPFGISNPGVAQRHQVIPELTLPFSPGADRAWG
jgi:hypothetical protein